MIVLKVGNEFEIGLLANNYIAENLVHVHRFILTTLIAEIEMYGEPKLMIGWKSTEFPSATSVNIHVNPQATDRITYLKKIPNFEEFIYADVLHENNCLRKPITQAKSSGFDGSNCKSCREPVYMAGPNQTDGSFVCYSCKQNPYRNFRPSL